MSGQKFRHGRSIAVLLALVPGACAAPGTDGRSIAALAQPVADIERADRVADALLMASQAERGGDGGALVRAAQRLDRLGPAPQTEADAASMRRWLESLPPDAEPLRGRALGPAWRSVALPPGASTRLNQTFLGGRSAMIVVRVAQGPAPRLVVRDQSDRQVCNAVDDPVKCRWVPLYTQRHAIEIANTGQQLSEFYIVFD